MDQDRAVLRLAFARGVLGDSAPAPQRASSDAGFRSYWRVADAAGTSWILMDSPPDLEDVRPWLAMHEVLERGGLRVPATRARDVENGLILMEDLGSHTLLQILDADNADAWFDQAIELLVRLQHLPAPEWLPAYDTGLVQRELDLFPAWFLQRHLGLPTDGRQQQALAQAGELLSRAFEQAPRVLVHRDYMPRNLIPAGGGLAVLDFQDAVRGPPAYDAASLFLDAFLSWPLARVQGWLRAYHDRARAAGVPLGALDDFQRELELIGIQRHLKVLGIFARLHHRDAKPRYLADAARFLAYLDRSLAQHVELQPLHALLRERVFPRIAPLELPA